MKLLVLVLLQKCCPDKHIGNLGLIGHVLGESFARTDRTQATTLLRNSLRSSSRGRIVADSVKNVFQAGVCGSLDALRHLGIAVIESMTSAHRLDEIVVSGAASRYDIQTIVLGDLDSVEPNACYNV